MRGRPRRSIADRGGKGRHYDFSQWYPKVAVYDRGGWEAQPFIPNGEMYGEFGTFDVTLNLAADQVVGATGVPVAGDPGWERAKAWGEVHYARDAYGARAPSTRRFRRWRAGGRLSVLRARCASLRVERRSRLQVRGRDVPRRDPDPRADRAGAGREAGKRRVREVERARARVSREDLRTVRVSAAHGTHPPRWRRDRVPDDGDVRESVREGTVSHEVGHIYSYGMLANNEWREGWLDEGLTSYQSEWRVRATPQDIGRGCAASRGRRPRGAIGRMRT